MGSKFVQSQFSSQGGVDNTLRHSHSEYCIGPLTQIYPRYKLKLKSTYPTCTGKKNEIQSSRTSRDNSTLVALGCPTADPRLRLVTDYLGLGDVRIVRLQGVYDGRGVALVQ